MDARGLFIVGDSIFADTLAGMFANSPTVRVVGCAPTPRAALAHILETCPEAIIVASASGSEDERVPPSPNETTARHWEQLLVQFPNIPLIRADLAADTLLLITCKQIDARPAELIHALTELPKKDSLAPRQSER
ncbi:MAG: hypothetical protein IT331_21500 [Anaerolineae bacterium]|nr:hypothetical protein [Anaerolineae bacterium]